MICATSGSSGIPKKFVLAQPIRDARYERLVLVQGDGFEQTKGLFCAITAGTSAVDKYMLYCHQRGIKFYRASYALKDTLNTLLTQLIDALIAWPMDLLLYARELDGQKRFPYLQASGMRVHFDALKIILAKLLAPGGHFYSSYGCSEVGRIALATPEHLVAGATGRLVAGAEVKTVDGEIWARTPVMIKEYTDPQHNWRFVDGWFRTGDRGRLDGDLLYLFA